MSGVSRPPWTSPTAWVRPGNATSAGIGISRSQVSRGDYELLYGRGDATDSPFHRCDEITRQVANAGVPRGVHHAASMAVSTQEFRACVFDPA